MENTFVDLNKALNHAIGYVGRSEVSRNGRSVRFNSSEPLQALLTLLTEVGVSDEAKKIYEPYHLINDLSDTLVWNFLLLYGNASGFSPAKPGYLFRGISDDGKTYFGLTLEVNAMGEPTKFLAVNQSYPNDLLVIEKRIAISNLLNTFSISNQPLTIAPNTPLATFYGDGLSLKQLIQERMDVMNAADLKWGDWNFPRTRNNSYDLVKFICTQTPDWVWLRLANVDNMDELRKTVATLGKGIQPYAPGTSLPIGTLLFTKTSCGIVIALKSNGDPMLMLQGSANYYHQAITFRAEDVTGYWLPDVTPFAYEPNPTRSPAYTDINRLRGHLSTLSFWRYRDIDDVPLFKCNHLLQLAPLTSEMIEVLKNGPDQLRFWPPYLSQYGKGLQTIKNLALETGDFLLLDRGNEFTQAICINETQMLTTENYGNLTTQPINDVVYVWKPTPLASASHVSA